MNRPLILTVLTVCSSLTLFAPALAASHSSQKPTLKQAKELMAGVCSSGATTGACSPCPGFADSGFDDGMTLEAVTYGKFLKGKDTYALLDLSGCEPHVNNFGGSVLLRWQGLTRWKFVKYAPGYRTENCLKYPAQDGRDLLLCEAGYAGMGTVISSLLLEDLSQKEAAGQQLFSTSDSSGACLESGSVQELLEWKQIKLNGDRYPDLRATVKSGVYTRDTTQKDACSVVLKAGSVRTYTLEYSFDGAKFTPTQATRGFLKQLLKDNPDLLGY